jgi:hypothetical protein
MIREILKRTEANALFSFVIGVGLSVLLFHRVQKQYAMSALPVEELTNTITKIDGKCYRFRITDASEPST